MWLVVELDSWTLWFTTRTQHKNDHGVQGPQKTYFKAYIIHWHCSTCFAVGKTKKGAMVEESKCPWQRILFLLTIFLEKRRWRQKNGQNFIHFTKSPFWTFIKKKVSHSFLGARSLLLVHIQLTPSEGPKGFVNYFFQEIGPWKMTIFHSLTSWSMV